MFFRSPAVPIVPGRFRVRYGSKSVVDISGDPQTGYAITAVSRVRIVRSRHHLPPGTLLAEIRSKGGRRYVGWHGLWWVDTGRPAPPTKFVVTVDGDTLRGRGREVGPRRRSTSVYRRILDLEPRRPTLRELAGRFLRPSSSTHAEGSEPPSPLTSTPR